MNKGYIQPMNSLLLNNEKLFRVGGIKILNRSQGNKVQAATEGY